MKSALHEQEFSLLDVHFARFIVGLSGLQKEDGAHLAALIQRLSSATLDGGDSCVDLAAEADSLEILEKLPKTLCLSLKEYLAGASAPLVLFKKKLFLYRYFHYEFGLARRLREFAQEELVVAAQTAGLLDSLFPAENCEKEEPDWQKKAAELALTRKLAIISGGPGTGKTTTVVKILALLLEDFRQKGEAPPKIKLVAPTGKAAMRLGESVSGSMERLAVGDEIKKEIPRAAITLHRLLGVRQNSSRFRHNAENPLDCSVVVVDEASMVDVALMSKLVDALPRSCRLILLGDKDQLASVESGAVLAELLKGLPECGVQLEKSYRFNNNIKALAQAVNSGEASEGWRLLREAERGNLSLLSEKWFAFLAGRFLPYMEKVRAAMEEKEMGGNDVASLFKALRSFQILCATRKGQRGVEQVNSKLLHFFMGKNLCQMSSNGWFAGRPVMVTSNDYTLGLFNGDMGICLPNAAGDQVVWFEHYEKGVIAVPYGRLPEHETSFAITIHKSQGSEFADVAVLLPENIHRGLSRELLYTGITRAKENVWLLAEKGVFTEALGRSTVRQSGLRELLEG